MRDIRLKLHGNDDTLFDFSSIVEGKDLSMQKAMVDLATEQGTDPLWPERGTTMLAEAIGGTIISTTAAQHTGNFAAAEVLMFRSAMNYQDIKSDAAQRRHLINSISVDLRDIDVEKQQLMYDVEFIFNDKTKTTIQTKA